MDLLSDSIKRSVVSHSRPGSLDAAASCAISLQVLCATNPHLSTLLAALGRRSIAWAVVGGAVRSWVCSSHQIRDIDLCIDMPGGLLGTLIGDVVGPRRLVTKTSLGGFRIHSSTIIDAWSASDTPGIAEAQGECRLSRVLSAIPLAYDAILFSSDGRLIDQGYFDTVSSGILELKAPVITGARRLAEKIRRLLTATELRAGPKVTELLSLTARTSRYRCGGTASLWLTDKAHGPVSS
jgi:hypothetical protein